MDETNAGHQLQQLTGHVAGSPVAGRPYVDPAWIGFDEGNEFGNCGSGDRWVEHDDVRLAVQASYGRDIPDKIIIEPAVERCVDRIYRVGEQKSVSVSRRAYYRLRADVVAASCSIFDEKLLAETLREPLTEQARENVGRAASGSCNND